MRQTKKLTRLFEAGAAILLLSVAGVACPPGGAGDLQQPKAPAVDYSKSHAFPNILSAYTAPSVPRAQLANSALLQRLIQGGKLRLSLPDTIALALADNLNIAAAHYNLSIAQTDLLRATAGGATRGVAGSYQSQTIFSGVIGGGINGGYGGGGSGPGGVLGGGIPSVGAAGCCDPRVNVFYGWDHAMTPLNFTVVSGVPVEATQSAYVSSSYSQGFLTGTSVFMSLNGYRQASNATTQIFNPYISSRMFVGFNQRLLNGFGYRANAKFIRIAQNDMIYSKSVFRQRVISTVARVMALYYDLLADQENIRVAQQGLTDAKNLVAHSQSQEAAGTAAILSLARAQEDVATWQEDLLAAQDTFSQDAQSLKADISSTFSAEIASVEPVLTSPLPEPHPGDIPPFYDALREAYRNRPEIQQIGLDLRNQHITIQSIHNELLPTLNAYGVFSPTGLASGLGPTFTDVFRNRFPNYAYGFQLSIPIRNRVAQADAARALLEQRQLQIKLRAAENRVVWDVSKAVSAVREANGEFQATSRVTDLARQTLQVVKDKFHQHQATAEDLIMAQRNLRLAEDRLVKARVAYAKALIQFEQATGTILNRNKIELAEAEHSEPQDRLNIPGTPQGDLP